jgi:hypothetical protein
LPRAAQAAGGKLRVTAGADTDFVRDAVSAVEQGVDFEVGLTREDSGTPGLRCIRAKEPPARRDPVFVDPVTAWRSDRTG